MKMTVWIFNKENASPNRDVHLKDNWYADLYYTFSNEVSPVEFLDLEGKRHGWYEMEVPEEIIKLAQAHIAVYQLTNNE